MSANRKPMSTNHKKNHEKFYIDGAWVSPAVPKTLDVIDPATERAYTKISLGSAADVDRAVAAAKAAFPAFSRTTRDQRLALRQDDRMRGCQVGRERIGWRIRDLQRAPR